MRDVTIARLMCFAGLLCLAAPAAAQAPGGLSFQATLDSIKIDTQPQRVITRQFKLTLDENQRETRFRAHVEDWWRSEDGTRSFYDEPGKLRHSCGRWVSLNPVESSVKPGETLVIRITVAVPTEMASGGYWCALTVDEIPDPQAAQSGVGVRFVASVSTGIFVNVGTIERSARILDLQVAADQAFVKLRNEGNAPVGIDGRLEFYAPGASTPTATVVVPRGTLLTEPSVDGTLTCRLPAASELPSGRYRVRAILDYGAPHFIGAEREIEITRAAPPIPLR
ncbi:MAG TPA: hypothetical protein VJ813_11375 [Vicinamibacterales bacterium]|nr:hypothetical protein [Vicinamibacterales bacterium]